ncbi:hypothetical protein KUTeg_015080 [Tegillarca granosa]|uniref:C1q domain-containing protein n=1 Tax=Tegillarca granosa TaxID=220873 RepID=A0ABQ9EP25_TEGGR|nr:hypothetical protein KUTeg_015080 [Tegillarca granosa]
MATKCLTYKIYIKTLKTRQTEPASVAFTAQLSHDIGHLGSNEAIIFDKVVTNHGNGYESQTGHFTAPVAGIYHFTTTVMAYGDENVHIQIVKNGNEIARGYTSSIDFETSVAVVIVQMAAGDRVWVRHFFDTTTPHIHGLGYTSFSGFLITSEF